MALIKIRVWDGGAPSGHNSNQWYKPAGTSYIIGNRGYIRPAGHNLRDGEGEEKSADHIS